jgi:hypothetical protein
MCKNHNRPLLIRKYRATMHAYLHNLENRGSIIVINAIIN